jgi:hypothetical protein
MGCDILTHHVQRYLRKEADNSDTKQANLANGVRMGWEH